MSKVYDAEEFKARANVKTRKVWFILNLLLTGQYYSNVTKGTYEQRYIVPFLLLCWVPYIAGSVYLKIKGKKCIILQVYHNNRIWTILRIYSVYKPDDVIICIYISSCKYDYSV